MLADMYDVDIARSWTPDELWARFAAERAIDDAIAALEEAGASLAPLIADTDWRAQGVRALHEELRAFSTGAAAEITQLRSRLWELGGVPGA